VALANDKKDMNPERLASSEVKVLEN